MAENQKPPDGPYLVREGDCLSSIAFEHGFSIDRIWNDDANATLKELRTSPHVLAPKDELTIPAKEQKHVAAVTGKTHVFRRRNVPETLQLRFEDAEGKPRAGVPYAIDIDGKQTEGTTTDTGAIELTHIRPDATEVWILLDGKEEFELVLGELDPADTPSGAHARLVNLGFLSDNEPDLTVYLDDRYELTDDWERVPRDDARALAGALLAFQEENELTVSGELDEATVAKLIELHGS